MMDLSGSWKPILESNYSQRETALTALYSRFPLVQVRSLFVKSFSAEIDMFSQEKLNSPVFFFCRENFIWALLISKDHRYFTNLVVSFGRDSECTLSCLRYGEHAWTQ